MREGEELQQLLDYAERARIGDWSLRSALVRYAQPEPARASAVLELVRRTDRALEPYARATTAPPEAEPLLAVAAQLDHLGDVLAAWATDPAQPRPDGDVDHIARDVFRSLGELGIARESRPPRRRG